MEKEREIVKIPYNEQQKQDTCIYSTHKIRAPEICHIIIAYEQKQILVD